MGEINFKNVDIEGLESSHLLRNLRDYEPMKPDIIGIILKRNLLPFRHLNGRM